MRSGARSEVGRLGGLLMRHARRLAELLDTSDPATLLERRVRVRLELAEAVQHAALAVLEVEKRLEAMEAAIQWEQAKAPPAANLTKRWLPRPRPVTYKGSDR